MKLHSRWLGAAALAAAAVGGLATPRAASAQDAVVVIKSAGELLGDLRFLVEAVAPPDQAAPVLQMLDQIAGPQALKGLDRAQPIVLMASMPADEGSPPTIVGAVPVSDLNAMMTTLRGLGLAVADSQVPGFSHQITLPDGNTTVYVVTAGQYALITPIPSDADALKATKVADWIPKRTNLGDISATINLEKLPDEMKQQILEQVKAGIASESGKREEGQSDAEYRAQQVATKLVEEAFTRFVEDTSAVALDLTTDQKTQQVSAELSVTAKPGTPMADALAGFANRKSRYRAMTAGAPVAMWASVPMPAEFQQVMADLMDEAAKKANEEADDEQEKKLAEKIVKAITPTLTADELQFGMAIQGPLPKAGAESKYVMVAAAQVVDGKELEKAVREAAALAKPEDKAKIQLDFAKAADGTAIHRFTGDPDDLDDDAAKAFGKDSAGYVAFQDDTVYMTFGADGQAAIEKSLTARPAEAPTSGVEVPVAVVVHTSKLAGMMQENQEEAAKAAAEVFVGPNASKDRVALTLGGQGSTLRLRFFIDIPALSFFGRVGTAMTGQAPVQIDR